jgi:hypothetical protein
MPRGITLSRARSVAGHAASTCARTLRDTHTTRSPRAMIAL